jgi:hypothetical protein
MTDHQLNTIKQGLKYQIPDKMVVLKSKAKQIINYPYKEVRIVHKNQLMLNKEVTVEESK